MTTAADLRCAPVLLMLAGGMALTGCDTTGPTDRGSLAISVATRRSGISSSRSSDVLVGTGANSLRITKVEFVLAETELSQASSCSASNEDDEDDCDEIELDPILVDLPLDGVPPRKVIDALVPAGTYTRIETKLRAIKKGDDDEKGAAKFIAAHPNWPSALSVRVAGVYTDAGGAAHDFTFTSSAKSELEMAFASPVKVDATTENLTITVDVARWFKDAAGNAVDPRSSANSGLINTNIRKSFKAFKDNDRDAHDDDQGEDEDEPDDDKG